MGNINLFSYEKSIPTTKETETEHMAGHFTDNVMKSSFEKLCKWLDEQIKLFTMSDLHAKLSSFAEKDRNIYCLKWMKKQWERHYQNLIFLN